MGNQKKRCKDCAAEGITTARPAPHPGPRCASHHRQVRAERKDRAWEQRLIATYGITAEEYWAIYEAQGGRCYICRRATGKVRKLAVDHDHQSGLVRGLLDKSCNRNILGHSRDDIEFFERCIAYLQDPPARAIIGERVAPVHEKEDA
ncbi:endonuclease VII domain-containing protein [Brevibacterium album]|uniref:endonuclease VII domain-containing protein n=1 Tax=Brevibacterium album TaxID=417948 RepID=UPI00049191E5|nr:endonuclease VII domain-containing protein [Brevibacterium album]